ncbi:Sphingosine kinase A, partial [Tetrabaena socialis]
ATAGGQAGSGEEAAVDLIMFVGGDGTMYEGLQGLFQRPDWAAACRVPMAAVPCGSGNGLAASAGLWDPVTAAVAACRGRVAPVDVASVLQPPGNRYYCLLSVVYGAMANLDIGTQHLRWMGELRFHLGGLWEVIRGRYYNCRVFVLPPADPAATDGPATPHGAQAGTAALSASDVGLGLPRAAPGGAAGAGAGAPAPAVTPAGPSPGAPGSMQERLLPPQAASTSTNGGGGGGIAGCHLSDYPAGPPLPLLSQLGSLPRPLPDSPASLPPGWTQLADSLAILGAYNTQYLALGARANPGGRMGDGAWDVWHMDAVPGVGANTSVGKGAGGDGAGGGGGRGGKPAGSGMRMRSLRVLLGIEDGSFAKAPDVMRVVKARALLFEQRDSNT